MGGIYDRSICFLNEHKYFKMTIILKKSLSYFFNKKIHFRPKFVLVNSINTTLRLKNHVVQ